MTATSNNKLKNIRKRNEQLIKDAYWTRPDESKVLWRDLCDQKGERAEALEGLIEHMRAERDKWEGQGELHRKHMENYRAKSSAQTAEIARLRARVAELTAQLASASTPDTEDEK